MIAVKDEYSLINPTPRNDAPELVDLPNSTTLFPFTIALRFLPTQKCCSNCLLLDKNEINVVHFYVFFLYNRPTHEVIYKN